jgi:hypothetical protein
VKTAAGLPEAPPLTLAALYGYPRQPFRGVFAQVLDSLAGHRFLDRGEDIFHVVTSLTATLANDQAQPLLRRQGPEPAGAGAAGCHRRNTQPPTGVFNSIEQFLNTMTGGASRAALLSPGFNNSLNAIDGFFASGGIA